MKDRIIEFLRRENKSSAQFAEEIGVQPSGISHIISGRNNPSLDFILKMLEKYPSISSDWLLFGKGIMYNNNAMPSLFANEVTAAPARTEISGTLPFAEPIIAVSEKKVIKEEDQAVYKRTPSDSNKVNTKQTDIDRIVWFYKDKTFREFFPETE